MNPFAAFLQPPTQRSPLAGAGEFINDIARLNLARQAQAQDVIQQKDSSARDWKRIGMQEAAQSRNFSDADKKEVESLLAEYQDAEDQGDPVRLDRAGQMLKRFGMDVTQGASKPLPGKLLPDVSAPIGAEQDLPQSDWEERLVSGSQVASGSSTEEPDIAGHLKSVGPLKPLKLNDPGALPEVGQVEDLGDVDSPEFQAAAAAETGMEQQMSDRPASQLPGQLLPTIISKSGKKLYESTGPSGRYSPMVQSVFEPFAAHENPQIAEAAKSAQALANKLIHVDGVNPAKAIEMARDQMNTTAGQTIGLERTKLGTRPKWGSGGGGAVGPYTLGAGGKADAALNDDADKVRTMWVNSDGYKKMAEQAGLLDDAEGGLLSPDGVSQNNALATLKRIQSGLTLNAQEMSDFQNAAGYVEGLKKQFERYLGKGELPEEYKRQVAVAMGHMRQVINRRMQRGAEEAYAYFMKTRRRSASPEIVKEKGEAIRDSLRGDGKATPDNSDLYE